MSRASYGKSNVPMRNSRNAATNVRISSARSKSIDPGKFRQHRTSDMSKKHIEKRTLEEYGYHFLNGKLVSIEDNKPFEFYVYPNDDDNHKRYHSIGRLIDNYIYNLLETECQLRRIEIPIDPKRNEPTGFFFASDNLRTAPYLMIIIHGMGVVRAGQWSRKLIMNESLQIGSQLDYIQEARANDYSIIVTNTNLNVPESPTSYFNAPRRLRGSGSAEEHACYIWENFVQRSYARHICIVAHSYGGAVVLELASRYLSEFDRRVFAIALTDSPMNAYSKHACRNVLKILEKKTINWVAGTAPVNTDLGVREYGRLRSAGHTEHEWTSYTAFRDIFQFIKEERQKLERHY